MISWFFQLEKWKLIFHLIFINRFQKNLASFRFSFSTFHLFSTWNSTWKGLCPHDGMCLIFLVASETKGPIIENLAKIQNNYPKFSVVWVDRLHQKSFVNSFPDVPKEDAVIVLNMKRLRYAYKSEIDPMQASSLVDAVKLGDISWKNLETSPLNELGWKQKLSEKSDALCVTCEEGFQVE